MNELLGIAVVAGFAVFCWLMYLAVKAGCKRIEEKYMAPFIKIDKEFEAFSLQKRS